MFHSSKHALMQPNEEETKSHIAEYFENLYQAREGKPEYQQWTNKITETVEKALKEDTNNPTRQGHPPINIKEMNKAVRKLKRKKSLGPDNIPNEVFIESSKETAATLTKMINNVHQSE